MASGLWDGHCQALDASGDGLGYAREMAAFFTHTGMALILVLSLGACGDDGGTAWGGIYEITSWTEHESSCATEGPSILMDEGDTHFFVRTETFFADYLAMVGCETLAECETEAADKEALNLFAVALGEGNDAAGWHGLGGYIDSETCAGDTLTTQRLFETSEGNLRFEEKWKQVDELPRDDEGCDLSSNEAVAIVEAAPCVRWQVQQGTFVQGL